MADDEHNGPRGIPGQRGLGCPQGAVAQGMH
jgi:hypothetical protein